MRRDRRGERAAWSLVGRDGSVALLDKLIRRGGGPVPIVVVCGLGGIGKSELLTSIFERYRLDAPVVRVNLDDGPPKAWYAVLDDACERLTSQRFGVFGRVTMPRYALIRDIQREFPRARLGGDKRRLARSLLAGRSDVLATAGELGGVLLEQVVPAPAEEIIGARPQGALRGLLSWARPLPVLRWVLGGVGYVRVLRWFERTAAVRLPDVVDGDGVDLVQACWRHMDNSCMDAATEAGVAGQEDESADEQASTATVVDRLAVEAFLADIACQYPLRRRLYRRVNCVLLLDGADLLSPEDGRLISLDRDRRQPTRGDDVLELLAQAKQHVQDAPLLIVATKQAASPSAEHSPVCRLDDGIDSGVDARVTSVLRKWRCRWDATHPAGVRSAGRPELSDEQVDSAYLYVRLPPLTLAQTARMLAGCDTDPTEAQLWELHQVTRGHPLALRMIVDALRERARLQGVRRWPAIRTLLDAAAVGRSDAAASETVGDYLLFKTFFQRFPDDPVSCDGAGKTDRVRTRKVLANLAAARALDMPTLRLLAPDRVHEKMWDDLVSYSFVERTDQHTLVLDPLLRDLLIRRLALHGPDKAPGEAEPADLEFSYAEVHQRLREYFSTGDGNHRADARQEAAYHSLALGDPAPAAELFARRMADPRDHGWAADLENLATAPRKPEPVVTALTEMPPQVAAVAEIIEATQQLMSVTSHDRWSAQALRRLADLYDAGHERFGPASTDWHSQAERYGRLGLSTFAAMPAPITGPAKDARRAYRPPHAWRPLRPGYVAVAALVLAGSAIAVEGVHLHTTCARDSGWAGELTRPLRRDGLRLARTADSQCVGVTDRPGVFIPGNRTASMDDEDVAVLTRLIDQENANVLRASAHGKRYVTIVVATILSTADRNSAPGRAMSTGANALRGALTAQRAWNQFESPSEKVLLRLLIANLGGNAAHAKAVAEQIREVAQADHTVVAVTGLGHTRVETLHALQRLGPDHPAGWSGMPVVASTISGDVFSGRPYFFRVGPSNDRQAEVAVRYINGRFRDRRPFIVFDDSDLYSIDLMTALTRRLSTDGRLPVEPSLKSYQANLDDTAAQLRKVADSICQESQRRDASPLILFTGRANEIPELLADINEQPCGHEPTVFGGDALSTLETVRLQDFRYPNQYRNDQLFYTSFGPTGPEDYDQVHGPGSAEKTDFFGRYREVQQDARDGGSKLNTPATSHIMLAYDAVMLIRASIQTLPGPPTPEQLYNNIRVGTPHHGVAGIVNFGPTTGLQANTDPLDKLIVVQRIVGTPGTNGENSLRTKLVYHDGEP